MKRFLSYLIAFLVAVLLAASILAPAPGSRIVQTERNADCRVLQKQYQICRGTHADVGPCEEITALWVKCIKNQGAAGTLR